MMNDCKNCADRMPHLHNTLVLDVPSEGAGLKFDGPKSVKVGDQVYIVEGIRLRLEGKTP